MWSPSKRGDSNGGFPNDCGDGVVVDHMPGDGGARHEARLWWGFDSTDLRWGKDGDGLGGWLDGDGG